MICGHVLEKHQRLRSASVVTTSSCGSNSVMYSIACQCACLGCIGLHVCTGIKSQAHRPEARMLLWDPERPVFCSFEISVFSARSTALQGHY